MPNLPELLNPAQACGILGITPGSVNRLTREGYLEVKEKVAFKNGDMQLFLREQVQALMPAMPRIKQAWERQDNYRHGASRMARARAYRHKSYLDKINRKEQFFKSLELLPEKSGRLLRAAYYLFHLNHYAKAGSAYLYDIKEIVLHTFVKNFYHDRELLQVSYIEGENKLALCPECKNMAQRQRLSYTEYIDKTGGCIKCTREFKYYSLYEFTVTGGDYNFCFHTPYKVARKWFDRDNTPPVKHTPGREGAYAFGRAIYDSEAQDVELMEVIEELQKFLAGFGIKPLIL